MTKKIAIIGTSGMRMRAIINTAHGLVLKQEPEFELRPLHDMGEVIELVKRSKTAQHKELMRKGRREFHKK